MTPMQNHRLAGGAEKDIARQAETFHPYKEKYDRCQKWFKDNK